MPVSRTLMILWVSLCFIRTTHGETKTENVVLITTDGLRWQELFMGADLALMNEEHGKVNDVESLRKTYWRENSTSRREALMPFFWKHVPENGQVFGNLEKGSPGRVTNGKFFSYPGYNELLTGISDPRIDSNDKVANPNLNVLEWLHQFPEFRNKVAAFCSWDVFPYILNAPRSGIYTHAGWSIIKDKPLTEQQFLLNRLTEELPRQWPASQFDALTYYTALEHIKRHQPRVLFIAFDETDNWAHDGRYDRYLEAAHRVDHYLENLWSLLQSIPQYRDKTSFVITTDHGRGTAPVKWRSHGSTIEGAEYFWVAITGPDTPPRGERTNTPEITQAQVAATLADLLERDFLSVSKSAAPPIDTHSR